MKKRAETKTVVKDSDYRSLAQFRHHIRRYLEFSDHAARAAGIEPQQYQLLLALRGLPDNETPTVGGLSKQLRVRHHSTVELVDRAERNGLVTRTRSGSVVIVGMSRKGERLLERVVAKRLQELRVAGPALVDALRKLIGARTRSRTVRDK
jgi:DNA-binding MarR family transcriptional regulator